MRTKGTALALAAVVGVAACGGSNAASTLVKPPVYDPEQQTKCKVAKSQSEPLIVEWPDTQRGKLETLSRDGLVVVRYTPCATGAEMGLLGRCRAKALPKYAYKPLSNKKENTVRIKDEDQLYLNMPVGAAKLESTLKTKGQLEVVTTLVGRYEAPGESWSDADLTGECEGATHMIAALSVGAFTFSAGGAAEVGGGASVGPAGAGAKSAAAKELLQKDGETASCGGAKASDREPPQGCGGPFQIEVVPLRATRAAAAPPPPVEATAEPASARPAATLAVQPPRATPPAPPPGEASGMVSIPGGTFWMGSPDGEGYPDEHPRHQATVAAFQMDRTEVTVAAYKACVDARGCSAQGLNLGVNGQPTKYCNWGAFGRSGHPINCVEWNQATAYCAWAGKRLPTETEWEYAARGTDARKYPWGSAAPSNQLCWDGDGSDLGRGNRQSTCAVGSYPAGRSPFGLEDMAGNVWEWTSSPKCDYPSKSCVNTARVYRGGGWDFNDPALVRGAYRIDGGPGPGSRVSSLGFRCARSNP